MPEDSRQLGRGVQGCVCRSGGSLKSASVVLEASLRALARRALQVALFLVSLREAFAEATSPRLQVTEVIQGQQLEGK